MTYENNDSKQLTDGGILSPRLQAVCDMIGRIGDDLGKRGCLRLTDVGTDHAKLPIQCIKSGICSFVYAADLREGPLAVAKKNITEHGIGEDSIVTVLSDGLDSVPHEYDCVSICGMGGLLIADIISRCEMNVPFAVSPMSSVEDLREWLYNNSYSITDERVTREDRRLYTVMRAEKTDVKVEYSLLDCYFSPAMRDRYPIDGDVRDYFDYILSRNEKIVNAQKDSVHKTENYDTALRLLEEGRKFINDMREK